MNNAQRNAANNAAVAMKPRSKNYFVLPIFSGILIVFSQPPISFYPAAFIALVPLIHSLKKDDVRHNFLSGFAAGTVSYLGLLYWVIIAMNRYGGIDIFSSFLILLLLVLYLAFYIGIFTALVPHLEKRLSVPIFIAAPIVWVLMEYIRGVALTGFPWSLFAYSQHRFLPFIQVASVAGPYFISFLVVAINCIAYRITVIQDKNVAIMRLIGSPPLIAGSRPQFFVYTGVILFLCVASLVYGYTRLADKDEGNLKVFIVQGNIPQHIKWDEALRTQTVKTYYQKTIEGGAGADLIVWPETAMPFVFDEEVYVNRFIMELPTLLKSNLLFGAVSKDGTERLYNTAYIYGSDGRQAGQYSKVHLVPFGEYTPLVRAFPFLAKITAAGGDFHPGASHRPISTALGKVGILICYEGIFPSITNTTVQNGGQVLANITNDGWFGKTSAPHQHLAFYIFRAIETDRYVLRAANTGISAIIDPRGRTRGTTDIFKEEVLRGTFSLRQGQTPYVKHGDWFVWLALLTLAMFCGIRWIHTIKKREAKKGGSS